jgi:hypothetical protein
MIDSDQTFGTFDIYCDEVGCDRSEQFDTDGDFYRAIKEAKEAGWTMKKDGNEWVHTCPMCSGKE